MNSKVNIGEILSKSWRIVWKFKILWIFGILAGCAGGNGSRFNFSGNSNLGGNQNFGSGGSNSGQLPNFLKPFQGMRPERMLQEFLVKYGLWIGLFIVLMCVLWVMFYAIGIMGRTGLIKGAAKADAGTQKLSFGELWSESTPYFWRMFGLNVLIGLPIFLIFVIILAVMGFGVYSAVVNHTQGGGLAAILIGMVGVFVALVCVISLVSVALWFIAEQAQNAIVLEDMPLIASFSRGWQVFKSAWLSIILVSIILGLIGGIAGFVIAIPILVVIGAGAIGAFASYAAAGTAPTAQSIMLPVIIGSCCVILYLPVLLAFSGSLQAYTQTAMTLVYRRLTVEPVAPVFETPDVETLR